METITYIEDGFSRPVNGRKRSQSTAHETELIESKASEIPEAPATKPNLTNWNFKAPALPGLRASKSLGPERPELAIQQGLHDKIFRF